MLEVRATSLFKKDTKRAEKQGKEMRRLHTVVSLLINSEPLPPQNRDHALTGNYVGHRECHLSSDWLLIYKIEASYLILVRVGSHSELF